MNLTKLFQIQKELDEAIIEKKELQGKDLLPERILALLVELGECANEWRGFKFWSENQKARTFAPRMKYSDPELKLGAYPAPYNPLLEEYVDCLHFVLSIGNSVIDPELNGLVDNIYFYHDDAKDQENVTNYFLRMFDKVGDFSAYNTVGNFKSMLNIFLVIGESLGFTWEEIEQAYLDKNKINHERQANGY
ncbi:dUTP diphosphatase [Shouchella miscanthi]|uniref:dUTP diphosphatase n=1 Tax=Shouchella miscanthi TaxID=2598861 RepID=UPI0011A17797|nr:dUTP diphosphatase [Shouchella miscanthi]